MPINKDAMMRYKILDKCFRNTGRSYRIEDLMEECTKKIKEINPEAKGISRRQIYNDINFMESSEGWEIDLDETAKEGRIRYYRYTDPKFSIDNMPLNEAEIEHLRSAIHTLGYFKGIPQFEWMEGARDTLDKMAISAGSAESQSVVEFENNPYIKGDNDKFFAQIYDAIIHKTVLLVKYKPFDMPEMNITFYPYYLKQYNRCWYAFGKSPENKNFIWNFALERIVNIEPLKMEYYPLPKDWDWSDYFSDIVGVTRFYDAKVETVVIHVFGKTAYYIEARPWHESQKNKWLDNKVLEVTFNVIVNYEFEKLLLSYADSIQIISPKTLIKKHTKRLENALKNYSKQAKNT